MNFLNHIKKGGMLFALVLLLVGITTVPPAQATINPDVAALDLATAISADPASVTGANFVTKPPFGKPYAVSDTPLAAFPTQGSTYAILTTGSATSAALPNNSQSTSTVLFGPNVRGDTDYDVTILKIDLAVPTNTNCLTLDFRFLTEEFPEFIGGKYNDAFIAELDNSNWTTAGSTITAPNNFAFDSSGKVVSVNTAGMTAQNALGTTYDGATPLLQASTPVTPGTHSLYLSIFDQGDKGYDSAAFIDNLTLGTVQAGKCVPGARVAPPTTTATLSPLPNAAGWNNTDVTVSLAAVPGPGGAAIQSITYSATGAQPIASTTTPGASATFTISAEGQTTLSFFAKDASGTSEAPKTLTVKIDKTKPMVGCATPESGWKATDIRVSCAASDTGAGLATVQDSSFSLTTSVPTDTETASAATSSRIVCDLAANCTTAGPFTGLKVDKKAPTITLTTPSDASSYTLGQVVTVSYSGSSATLL